MDVTSVQPRFEVSEGEIERAFLGILELGRIGDEEVPPYGDPSRDRYLRKLVREEVEPILTGAIGSFIARFVALGWSVVGGRNKALRAQRMLAGAEAGQGWDIFLSKVLEDMLVCDKGGFIELGTLGRHGPVVELFHLDACCCRLTGNAETPVLYVPEVGSRRREVIPLDRYHVVHLPLMPSPDERRKNLGFSPVSRALFAAQILRAINQYQFEKLSNLPPEGLLLLGNISRRKWKEALAEAEAERMNKRLKSYRALLVLSGQDPTKPPTAEIVSFSSLPEHFNLKTTVEIYVKTLALALGVDVAEIWQIEHVGATKASVTIQHQKARGKGIGLIISMLERAINYHALPSGVVFRFDLPDDEQDRMRAEIKGQKILNVRRLFETNRPDGESIISRQEARALLVEEGILPSEFARTERVSLEDVVTRQKEALGVEAEPLVMIDRRGNLMQLEVERPMEPPKEREEVRERLERRLLAILYAYEEELEEAQKSWFGRKQAGVLRKLEKALGRALEEEVLAAFARGLGKSVEELTDEERAAAEEIVAEHREKLSRGFLPALRDRIREVGVASAISGLASRLARYGIAAVSAWVHGLGFGKDEEEFIWRGILDDKTCDACRPLIGRRMKWKDRPFTPGGGDSPICDGGCRCWPEFL